MSRSWVKVNFWEICDSPPAVWTIMHLPGNFFHWNLFQGTYTFFLKKIFIKKGKLMNTLSKSLYSTTKLFHSICGGGMSVIWVTCSCSKFVSAVNIPYSCWYNEHLKSSNQQITEENFPCKKVSIALRVPSSRKCRKMFRERDVLLVKCSWVETKCNMILQFHLEKDEAVISQLLLSQVET